jgi:hypothetical protein
MNHPKAMVTFLSLIVVLTLLGFAKLSPKVPTICSPANIRQFADPSDTSRTVVECNLMA